MHREVRDFVRATLEGRSFSRVLEVGSRDINGAVRDLVRLAPGGRYLGLDLEPGRGVDRVATFGPDWRERAGGVPETWTPDLVLCLEVLEHAPRALELVDEIAIELALNRRPGLAVITCASPRRAPHSAHDGGPVRLGEHYRGIPREELAAWLTGPRWRRATVVEDQARGDLYAWGEVDPIPF